MSLKLALVGCGKMGQALLSGWLNKNVFDISVIQPDPLPDDLKIEGFKYFDAPPEDSIFDVIVFAVKPQILNKVTETYKPHITEKTLILSIAAGKEISVFESCFGASQPVIRAMPNTPASIGKGITVIVSNIHVSDHQTEIAEKLFETNGETLWLDHENDMNAVTAISGSGPAYLFYFIEAFTKAAEHLGLSKKQSEQLARQTIIGAAALAEHNSDIPAANLRENVTSSGGTTEAALKVLMMGELQEVLNKAVFKATERGEELNK